MRWRELLNLNEQYPLAATYFEAPRRIHFVGIGGIGMSALALLLLARGHVVSGSDASENAMVEKLRSEGATVFIGQAAANVERAEPEALVYSSAIALDNPEYLYAQELKLPLWHRSQLLAHLVNTAGMSIAVSGTHGKSTTSAMIAHVLTECGLNPTAILGAVYPPFGSNVRIGNPDVLVVEADESDGSFTLLRPTVGVVLNMEPEHLENYDESADELWLAFDAFIQGSDYKVLNAQDPGLKARYTALNPLWYHGEQGNPSYGSGAHLKVGVPGQHNVSNAWGALTAVLPVLKNQTPAIREIARGSLTTFAGTLRRFERKGEAHGVVFYDDYGHHPTEVRATLEAARGFLQRPLTVVFQPHRYSRTQALGQEFGPAFEAADSVIITQLYSAYEVPIEGVSGRIVYDAVRTNFPEKTVFYAETLDEAQQLALEQLQPGDALLTMGAGDITTLCPKLLRAWEAQHGA